MTFEEFWPYYVRQHLDPVNRKLHFAGTTFGLLCLAGAPFRPALLLVGLAGAYGLAWIGHFFFEKNKPATFRHPLLSFRADLHMYGLMWRGKMI